MQRNLQWRNPRVVLRRKGRAFVARYTISQRNIRSPRFLLLETLPADDGAG